MLTGDIELLPKPFERVLIPQVVQDELANAEAPQAVRDWIAHAPHWLEVWPADPGDDDVTAVKLDEGESAAIALALDEFRQGRLGRVELRRLLGFGTRAKLDEFLTGHGVFGTYTADDLERDRRDLQRLGL